MSSQQQALIMETLSSIRKALKRKVYDSDSDSSADHNTNRGNKLKKRARFVRQGHLETTGGPAAYKEIAEHAGYQRAIIHHNPPLVDDDGYDLDSDDDDQHIQEVEAAAAEANPYTGIHLEQLFAPLTAITDLPTHPILSRPFTSTALDELASQACVLTHKESRVLRKVKPLQSRLHGDITWAPCGIMVGPDDEDLFADTNRFIRKVLEVAMKTGTEGLAASNEGQKESTRDSEPGDGTTPGSSSKPQQSQAGPDAKMQDTDNPIGGQDKEVEKPGSDGEGKSTTGPDDKDKAVELGSGKNGHSGVGSKTNGTSTDKNVKEDERQVDGKGKQRAVSNGVDVEMAEATVTQGNGARREPNGELNGSGVLAGPGETSVEDAFIHPLFITPQAAKPDRDLGLPEQESEDIRRLLQLYVQKQEEICRGTKRLYDGLLKADRYRKMVLKWAKAEAHCGPNRDMSDGEDWYDKEEWGLTEDLKKGQDEEEEDTAQTQKKTRNRR